MKELNMAIYTGKDGENKVTLTAAFATHEEAVSFHNGLARLAADSSRKPTTIGSLASWRGKLLPSPS